MLRRCRPARAPGGRHCAARRAVGGTSLIEVLVTLTIVAIGLLGMIALQVRSQTWQRDSFERKAVAELVSNLYNRVAANYAGYAQNAYQINLPVGAPLPAPAVCAVDPCTPAEVAARDTTAWLAELRRRVPTAAVAMTRRDVLTLMVAVAAFEPSDPGRIDPGCGAAGLPSPPGYRCYVMEMRP